MKLILIISYANLCEKIENLYFKTSTVQNFAFPCRTVCTSSQVRRDVGQDLKIALAGGMKKNQGITHIPCMLKYQNLDDHFNLRGTTWHLLVWHLCSEYQFYMRKIGRELWVREMVATRQGGSGVALPQWAEGHGDGRWDPSGPEASIQGHHRGILKFFHQL